MSVGDGSDLGRVVDLGGECDLSWVEVAGLGLMDRGEGDLDVGGEGRVEVAGDFGGGQK